MLLVGPDGWDMVLIYLRENWAVFLIGIAACLPLDLWFGNMIKNERAKAIVKSVFVTLVFIVSIAYIVKGAYNPFIYFNF